MSKKFRCAYIGSGSIRKKTADEIITANHEIVTVYSRRFESAGEFASRYDAIPCKTFEEAVDRDDIDGVYIGTPHTSHKEYAICALRLKKPVLCEKPMGVNVSEVEEMIAVAKEEGVYLAEAMWTWYAPVANEVRRWVQDGRVGNIKKAYASFCIPGLITKSREHRLLNPATAGGALLDLGIYPITYLYNLFGMPQEIQCTGELANGIDEEEVITFVYPEGECKIKSSLRYMEEKFKIVGDKGTISIPRNFHWASKAKLRQGLKTTKAEGVTDYITEFTKVADEILAGKKESDYVPLQHTLDCMKIMDECRRQMGLTYDME
jgi:predicted dehydrogenase